MFLGGERERIALEDLSGRAISYGSLARFEDRCGELLSSQLAQRSAVVVDAAEPLLLACLLVSLSSHRPVHPVPPTTTAHEAQGLVADIAPALLVTDDVDRPLAREMRKLGLAVFETHWSSNGEALPEITVRVEATSDGLKGARRYPEDSALLLRTSGTTGTPKLVGLSRSNIKASAESIAAGLELSTADLCLTIMPLTHIHGIIACLFATLASGGLCLCAPGRDPRAFWQAVSVRPPTWSSCVPTLLQSILDEAPSERPQGLSDLRFLRTSSASLPKSLYERSRCYFGVPLLEAYGMTEATHQIASNLVGDETPCSVGRPVGVEIAILDNNGKPVPGATVGEVCIAGPTVFDRYLWPPDANDKAFFDKWFRTGDLGYRDAEGRLWLTGRIKEQINRGGETISPLEIEEAVRRHEAVGDCVVFALSHPALGEEVAAACTAREGEFLDLDSLRRQLAELLPFEKIPKKIYLCSALPKTSSGKVSRIDIAKHFAEQNPFLGSDRIGESPAPAKSAGEDTLESAVVQLFAEALRCDRVNPTDNFFAMGGTSIQAASLIARAEAEHRVKIPLNSLINHATPSSFAGLLASRMRETGLSEPKGDNKDPTALPDRLPDSIRAGNLEMVDRIKTDAARADSIIRRDSAESDVASGSVHNLRQKFHPRFSALFDLYSALFDRYPIEEYISLLDATPKAAHYHHITEPVLKIWQDILSEEGAEALEIYNRATMLTLTDAFETRAARRDYPPSIIDQFRDNFSRIEEALQTGAIGTYVHTSDDFLKDFAICRQKVFPVRGAQVVEAYSGVPRSILFADGIGQFFRALFMFLFVTRGHKPVYRTHTHLSRVNDFTTEGRDLCFVQLAEMLERHPEVKGWSGGSWLYDPALGKISPRLADLCGRPASNGGWVFYVKDDHSGGAISMSATRRELYEEGKYQPKSYTVVWPRKKLIAWAKRR